jgi:putative resolvase
MYLIYGMKVSIGQAAKEPGVSRETLRRWEAAGKIQVERAPKGHRRYDLSKLYGITPRPPLAGRPTLSYACVSRHDQKEDLIRQVAFLETYCAANG